MVSKRKERIKATPSSGKLPADMGSLTRAKLATVIERTIKRRRLTRARAATLMAIDPSKVSALLNGRLAGFSSDRLLRLLMRLGQDIEIKVKAKPRGRVRGRLRLLIGAPA